MGTSATIPSGVSNPYAAYGGSVAPTATPTDPYAAYGGTLAKTPAVTPPPAATPDITANPKGEGVYRMAKYGSGAVSDKNAPVVGIPYSNVQTAQQQGYHFPEEGEFERYNKDNDADPNRPRDFAENFGEGVAHTAKSHAAGLVQLWAKMNKAADPADVLDYKKTHPGATDQQAIDAVDGKDLESRVRGTPYRSGAKELEQAQLKDAAAHLRENTELHGAGGWLGAAAENVGEYLGLDGLLKLAEVPEVAAGAEQLTQAQKMAAAAKTAKVLEENPKIAKLTALGMKTLASAGRTGAVSGAQTYLDTGGDAGAAATSAAMGAGTGAVLEGGLGSVGLAREAYEAKVADAARVQSEFEAARDAHPQAVADHKVAVQKAKDDAVAAMKASRQAEAQAGIANIANQSKEDLLTRFNEALPDGSPHRVDVTATPEARTFGDTAVQGREAGKQVYDALNEETGGKFNELQQARARALRARDFDGVEDAEAEIDKLLKRSAPNGVTTPEWKAAKNLWHDTKDLDRIHNAVEGSFNGISEAQAAKPGVAPRLLKSGNSDGGTLQTRLGRLQITGRNPLTESRIATLIGPDGLEGLQRASHLTSTPELKKATQNLVNKVVAEMPAPVKPVAPVVADQTASAVKELGKTAMAAGVGRAVASKVGLSPMEAELGGAAARMVWRQMITNPAVGKMAEYAVDYGATPERAAKLIAAMIAKSQTEQSQAVQP